MGLLFVSGVGEKEGKISKGFMFVVFVNEGPWLYSRADDSALFLEFSINVAKFRLVDDGPVHLDVVYLLTLYLHQLRNRGVFLSHLSLIFPDLILGVF